MRLALEKDNRYCSPECWRYGSMEYTLNEREQEPSIATTEMSVRKVSLLVCEKRAVSHDHYGIMIVKGLRPEESGMGNRAEEPAHAAAKSS